MKCFLVAVQPSDAARQAVTERLTEQRYSFIHVTPDAWIVAAPSESFTSEELGRSIEAVLENDAGMIVAPILGSHIFLAGQYNSAMEAWTQQGHAPAHQPFAKAARCQTTPKGITSDSLHRLRKAG